jgi:uncharacterized protein (DUF1778 family)
MLYMAAKENKLMAQTQNGTVRIDARVPLHIKEILVQAAALEGRTQSDFLISAVAEAARKVIDEHKVIKLCLADQQTLAAALLDEKRSPSARLRQAVRDHAAQVSGL